MKQLSDNEKRKAQCFINVKERIVHGGDYCLCKLISIATFLSDANGYLCKMFFSKSILVVIRGEKYLLNLIRK